MIQIVQTKHFSTILPIKEKIAGKSLSYSPQYYHSIVCRFRTILFNDVVVAMGSKQLVTVVIYLSLDPITENTTTLE